MVALSALYEVFPKVRWKLYDDEAVYNWKNIDRGGYVKPPQVC